MESNTSDRFLGVTFMMAVIALVIAVLAIVGTMNNSTRLLKYDMAFAQAAQARQQQLAQQQTLAQQKAAKQQQAKPVPAVIPQTPAPTQ